MHKDIYIKEDIIMKLNVNIMNFLYITSRRICYITEFLSDFYGNFRISYDKTLCKLLYLLMHKSRDLKKL